MSNVAHYFIAQHIPDLFRQEPRNVGVFVVKGGDAACKFLGQTEGGVLDKRKLKGLQTRDVYCQWVDYWKRLLGERAEGWQSQLMSVGRHYRVIDAGEVSDTDGDRASAVADYLYSLLVSDGGLAEALGTPEEPDAVTVTLADEVTEQLDAAHVVQSVQIASPRLVRRGVEVKGTVSKPHRPAFVQENGELYLMETVDFSTQTARAKDRAKDHAGWAAFMFDDVRLARPGVLVRAISIVRARPEDLEVETVQYGMEVLENRSDEVVNWLEERERDKFVRDRMAVAGLGGPA